MKGADRVPTHEPARTNHPGFFFALNTTETYSHRKVLDVLRPHVPSPHLGHFSQRQHTTLPHDGPAGVRSCLLASRLFARRIVSMHYHYTAQQELEAPKTTPPTPPAVFDYSAFIAELQTLLKDADDLPAEQCSHDSIVFSYWRRRLTQIIKKTRGLGYSVDCDVEIRNFGSQNAATSTEALRTFSEHLKLTCVEIGVIIQDYLKYGAPQRHESHQTQPAPTVEKPPLKYDKEATLKWYINNTPAKTLWGFILFVSTTAVGSFGLGYKAAGLQAQTTPSSSAASSPQPATVAAPTAAPASK